MESRKGVSYCIVVVFSIALLFSNTSIENSEQDSQHGFSSEIMTKTQLAYTEHAPIDITSNTDFSNQGFTGNGSPTNPYVIGNYNISTNVTCISISNTDAHFIIQNSVLTGGDSGHGVYLSNVTNGEIRNNTVTQKNHPVQLYYSSSNTLANNTIIENKNAVFLFFSSNNEFVCNNISGSYMGLKFSQSSYNTVENNTIEENSWTAISLLSSPHNTISNNTISNNGRGVKLEYSPDTIMSSNVMVNNSIFIEGTVVEYWRHQILPDNLVNGRSVGYYWGLEGGIFDGILFGQVILAFCSNVTVQNIVFNNTLGGITLGYSSNCTLNNNRFSNGDLRLFYSSNNTVVNNTLLRYLELHVSSRNELVNNSVSGNSEHGVILRLSSDNTLTGNTITGFQYCLTIWLDSDNNNLWNNTISDAQIYGSNIARSSNNVISGNYITGVWLSRASNTRLVNNTFSESPSYGVYCDSNSVNNRIYLNQFSHNDGPNAYDEGTRNKWNSSLMGNYWSDYSGSGAYHIPGPAGSIDYHPNGYVDTIPPEIDHPSDEEYNEGSLGHSITWSPVETNPSHYVVYQNGTEVGEGNWDGNPIIVSIDGLDLGVYNYTIIVYDIYTNWVDDSVIVTVIARIPTIDPVFVVAVSLGGCIIIMVYILIRKHE